MSIDHPSEARYDTPTQRVYISIQCIFWKELFFVIYFYIPLFIVYADID